MTGNDIPTQTSSTDSARDGCDDTPAAVLSRIIDDLSAGEPADIAPDERLVIGSLDEILTALVALRTDGAHGTRLIEDASELFGVEPSPGTVYPRLHDLEADGTLERYDLVQTKQYGIDDADAAASRIEDAMYQHLLLGLFLSAALDSV